VRGTLARGRIGHHDPQAALGGAPGDGQANDAATDYDDADICA
jgi:hypothetical protein